VDILNGEGVSREGELQDVRVAKEPVEKSGSRFTFGGERIGQGRENARYLIASPEIRGDSMRHCASNSASVTPKLPASRRERPVAARQDRLESPQIQASKGVKRAEAPVHRPPSIQPSKKLRKNRNFCYSTLYIGHLFPYDLLGKQFCTVMFYVAALKIGRTLQGEVHGS
jgi:hypothetical protein